MEKGFKDFKNYKRFPIQLSHQNIILIHLFSDSGLQYIFESHDMTEENQAAFEYSWKESEIAAQQFFSQLEGHYCDAFLEALIVEATKKLADSDNKSNELSKKLNKDHIQNRVKKALDKAKIEAEKI